MSAKAKSKDSVKKGEASTFVKGYLFLYNLLQEIGWSYLLYQVLRHLISGGKTDELWLVVKPTVVVFQNAAILEIINVAFGFVKSNLLITTLQVFSRVMIVCGVLLATKSAPLSIGLPLLLIAWSITEIIRYLFYTINLVSSVPYILVWLRYTLFYILYPVGVTGELLCFYSAQGYAAESKLWTVEFPNSINFTFNYQYFLISIMLSYIPFFPQMYFHMIMQRRKIIGGGGKGKKQS